MRKILVDDTQRELSEHGTEGFPMIVNHDDLWAFEGKSVPIHWHHELEISLPREGEAIYQIYQQSYRVVPGEGLLVNHNVPHSCHSPGGVHAKYSTILVRPDFLYGTFGSDVEQHCFRPLLQNSALPCIHLTGQDDWSAKVLRLLNQVEQVYDQKGFCYELQIRGRFVKPFISSCVLINRSCRHSHLPINWIWNDWGSCWIIYIRTLTPSFPCRHWRIRSTSPVKSALVCSGK